MVETLEHLIRRATLHPRQPREALHRELLRSETFLLTLDAPMEEEQVTRVAHRADTFPIWADKDPELGGVWVPVFPAKDAVAAFVARRGLQAPQGKEFLWMGHKPGAVFGLLRAISCFAGIQLHLDDGSSVSLSWTEVKALSEGKVPAAPERYEVPVRGLRLPRGSRLAFGRADLGKGQPQGRLLCLPEAGRFKADEARKLVRLDLGERGTAWMACRHFLQVLRFVRQSEKGGLGPYVEELLCSLVGFEMFGEAEALCEWIARRGDESYAWVALAAIYGKTGRLEDCANLCRKAAAKYPAEASFAVNGARALRALGRKDEAKRLLESAVERSPQDARLAQALQEAA